MPAFEILEHTADTGIRVQGKNLKELFTNAALGMMSIMVDPGAIGPKNTFPISVEGASPPDLMVAWLSEIIYLVDVKEMLFCRFDIKSIAAGKLEGTIAGESIDSAGQNLRTQIKACTYHNLKVGKENSDWFAQIIFDV